MFRFKRVRGLAALVTALLATLVAASGAAHAALLGVQQNYPDVTLGSSTLIYDANGVNATTGLLRVVSLSSLLSRAPGASTPAQSYVGSGDSVADVMLSFAINNSTGALVTNATYNKVTIGFGNAAMASPTAFGFSWQGQISQFGFNNTGTAFDARWTMTADRYQAMPAGYSYFVNGGFNGRPGGALISNTQPVAASGNIWAFDWVRGSFAGTSGSAWAGQIAPYVSGLNVNANRTNSTIAADVFLPLPASGWMLLSGLLGGVAILRRNSRRD